MADIGHNGGPDLAPRNFKKRWALALFDCQGTKARPKPDGAIAMAFRLYTAMDANGRGAVISTEEFVACCGVSERSVRIFKKWLYDFGFVQLVSRGYRGGASEFVATIPGEIPAVTAAIPHEIPATNTGKTAEYRQPIPAFQSGLPAVTAANREIAAANAGIPSCASRARLENPSGLLISKKVKEDPPFIPQASASGSAEKNASGHEYWAKALHVEGSYDVNDGVSLSNGSIVLVNGTRAKWLEMFGGDETLLDLALIQAANYVQPESRKPLKIQVEAQLGRQVAEKLKADARYAKAAAAKSRRPASAPDKPEEGRGERYSRIIEEIAQRDARK